MQLFRLRFLPRSSWRTPWEADTIFGLLCWACARKDGDSRLRQEIIDPSLAGEPPFVVSDAFPTGWMPAPVVLRDSGYLEHYKKLAPTLIKRVRKARWLSEDGFAGFQRGEVPPAADFATHEPIKGFGEINNQISRETNTTSSGRGPFVSESWTLSDGNQEKGMSIYVRTTAGYTGRFNDLFRELSLSGFGADVSVGKGEFEVSSELEPYPRLDQVDGPNASIVLSTFQPSRNDPTEGLWESIVKYGKLGSDFGLDNVFKRPMILFRPGALLVSRRDWFGRALGMSEFLEPSVVAHLESQQIRVMHPAFGLAVPVELLSAERSYLVTVREPSERLSHEGGFVSL